MSAHNGKMRVVGIDPAPKSGGHVFDGNYRSLSSLELNQYLQSLRAAPSTLICWDAPLTGPPDPEQPTGVASEFTKRPIEMFFTRDQWGFKVPTGISVLGYSGCAHWAISRHFLGLPRVGCWDRDWSELPFQLLTDQAPRSPGNYVVEVHPALALWLWCGFGEDAWNGSWEYKKEADIRQKLWILLCRRIETISPRLHQQLTQAGKPVHDDDMDARIAWLLGSLWIEENDSVMVVGDRRMGAFLLPKLANLETRYRAFRDTSF